MKIVSRPVSWWNGYETLFIEEPPRRPSADEIAALLGSIAQHKPLFYVPLPFMDFARISPLRHYPDVRWQRCIDSLGGPVALKNRSFIDLGGNIGYYAFLAAAAGASDAVVADTYSKCLDVTREAARIYGIPQVRAVDGLMEDYPYETQRPDIAFAFSSLVYVGRRSDEAMRALLRQLAEHVIVTFIEFGDGGSDLPDYRELPDQERLLLDCGLTPTFLGEVFASHSNTQRNLWRCDGARSI